MKNKILVEVYVPTIERVYSIYLPVNKKVGNIILLLDKAISEMMNYDVKMEENNRLYHRETFEMYEPDTLIRDTSIKNGTSLILL